MALQGWDKNYREQLKIQEQEIESLQQQLMIGRRERPAENPPPGGNPGKPPWPGYPNPMPPGKDWPSAGLRINPNTIMLPKEPAPAESDDDYGEGEIEGHPGWKLAAGPQLPNFKPMGRVIKGTREGVRTFEENKITQPLQIGPQAMDYPPPSELDKWLQLYQRNGGSLRHLDPDMRRLILQRGAMKANLPANNIRRLRDSGHKTDYTGGFVLGDDGKLVPVMGIIKADASNNIRRLNESGHQTVLDPITGQLKIVKTL